MAEESKESEPSKTEAMATTNTTDIAVDGDIVFVAGSSKDRTRVSSAMMSAASSVFRKMFGRFAEGQDLSSSSPKDVPLPDDNAYHTRMFCQIAHFKNDTVPQDVTCLTLRNFAIFVDKYDCCEAAALAVRGWWSRTIGLNHTASDWGLLLDAAFLLDQPWCFRSASMRAAQELENGHSLAHAKLERVPKAALKEIATQASNARKAIIAAVEKTLTVSISKDQADVKHIKRCKIPEQAIGRYMLHFINKELYPPSSKLPATVVACSKVIAELPDVDFAGFRRDYCCESSCENVQGSLHTLRKEVEVAVKSCSGLCLDCVKKGEKVTDGSCRRKHAES